MSGQYPVGYNSPIGGAHRGQFTPPQQQQQQQQQQQLMTPMNQMGMVANNPGGGGMMPMGGMMQMSTGMTNMVGGVGVMGAGMSPSHMQQQHPQMGPSGPVSGMMGPGGPSGNVMAPGGSNLMQQQQQHIQQQQQQQQSQLGSGIPQPMNVAHQTQANTNTTTGPLHQAQQQQQQQQGAPGTSNMLSISQPNSHKEINIVALSRLGQETVQDITSRFQEIFAALKIIQPTANRDNNTEKKVQEYFRTIRLLFKRVRIIYEKCNDGYPQGMEYTHIESLIPYKDEPDHRIEPTQCEEYRKALQENQELIETVKLKNRQLREIIDRTRIIIWEINTMLSMRRS